MTTFSHTSANPVAEKLSLAYLATRNLWVSTGAHVLNDWALFGLPLLAARMSP